MRGDLSEMSAADVCRELAASDADGILQIEGPDGRGALVWRDGQVIAASSPTPRARLGDRLIGAGLLSEEALEGVLHRQARDQDRRRLGAILVDEGLVSRDAVRLVAQEQVLDAVFDVLRWGYGAYRLDPLDEDATPEIPLRLPVPHLLAEIARRQREWAELERVIPDLAAVPSFRDQVTADAALEPDEFAVLASVDGIRSVRELADDLGYGEFEAARIVFGLWLLGIVEVAPPEDEVGRALEDALRDVERAAPEPAAAPPPARIHLAPPPHVAVPDQPPPTTVTPGPLPPPPAGVRGDEPAPDAEAPTGDRPSTDVQPATDAEPADGPDPWDALEAWAEPEVGADEDTDGSADPATGAGAAPPPPPSRPTSHQSPDEVDLDALIERLDAERPDPITPSSGGWVDPPDTAVAAGPAPDGPDGEGDDTPGPDEPAPPPRDADDVAELLRELSRLALDDDDPPDEPPPAGGPPPRPATPTARPADRDDSKRKRRGLFGR